MTRTSYLRQLRQQGRLNLDFFVAAQAHEEIRQVLWRELHTHRGQRALARMIGVGRSVVRKFIEMQSVPTPGNMAKIRDWVDDRPEVPVPLGSVCLAVLVADVDAGQRYAARRKVAQVLVDRLSAAGQDVPEWLRNEIANR